MIGLGERMDLAELWDDPYPAYKAMLAQEPVCWVPKANRYLVTRFEDIHTIEANPEIYSSEEPDSLMIKVMGTTMMRKDGDAHARERKACAGSFRAAIMKTDWKPFFENLANQLINEFIEQGEGDLFEKFAGPYAALCLGEMLGLRDASAKDLRFWSQALLDGTGNYQNDPEIWERAERAGREVDEMLQDVIPYLRTNPDHSIISSMLYAADPLNDEEIAGNVKVIIGGGLNEPRDSITVGVWSLLSHPDQLAQILEKPALWPRAFEEIVRWISPIGMYPRYIRQDTELGGVKLKVGDRVGAVIAAANRDPSHFDEPDRFDINRHKKPHLAFGAGPHFCLGTFAARIQVAEVAYPLIFQRLKNLRFDPAKEARFGGWVFRGLLDLSVLWDI